jgi:plastocyanin
MRRVSRILSVSALALLACRCSNKATPPVPPPDAAPAAASAATAEVVGTAPRGAGFAAIIMLEPRTPREFPAPTEPAVMDQQGLAFIPSLLLARLGQPVMFRNSEDVLHNVRVGESRTSQPVFNVATIPGNAYTHTFTQPGFYSVSCDVHESMHADILVTSTPYVAAAADDGSFKLSDVAAGSYKLSVLLGQRRIERAVEITGPRTQLTISEE